MRTDLFGLFWEDAPTKRVAGGERILGPIPPIPDMGWRPPSPSDLPDLRDAPVISFDVETFDPELTVNGPGWARGKGHIAGFSLAVPGRSLYIPIRHEVEAHLNLDADKMLAYAQHCLGGRGDKVGANLLYDYGWFRQEGVNVEGRLLDVQFAEALINSTSKINLEEIAQKYTGAGKDVDVLKDWILNYYGGAKSRWRKDIYRAPVSLVGAYGERDASAPLECIVPQLRILAEQGLLNLFYMECKLIRLLCDMRFQGVTVDIPYTEQLREDYVKRIETMEHELSRMAGMEINVNSGDSLARAFDKLGLIYNKTADGNPSFDKEFLSGHKHEFPKLVSDVRGLKKLVATFLESYLLNANVNGKVHGSFHPLSGTDGGARTGRFASSTPNLQNIPTRSDDGKAIRRAFLPDYGHAYWEKIDYSQIEYRFLAHFASGAGSDKIREAYLADPRTDYHSSTALLIKNVTGVELKRSYVKNINFGLAYGMGIEKLAHDLKVSVKEAQELSKAYHQGVPFARATMEKLADFADRMGFIETILGRRNYFDQWEPAGRGKKGPAFDYYKAKAIYGDNIQRAFLYRSLNYLLQGSSADQMKSAMVAAYESGVFAYTGVPRLTVHDELCFSIPNPHAGAAMELKRIMENVIPLKVPVIAERESGVNWGSCSKDGPHAAFYDAPRMAA